MINYRKFLSANELIEAASQLISQEIARNDNLGHPYALMFSGGKTPQPLYRQLENLSPASNRYLRLFLSDERYVPPEHPQNNAQHLWPLVTAWGIPPENFLAFDTNKPLADAAAQYQATMQRWLDEGITLPLGFLGLGQDGHTASIFTKDKPPPNLWATTTITPNNLPRLTVTANILGRFDRLIFLVTDQYAKREAIAALIRDPNSIPAGWATRRCAKREIWYVLS